MRAAARRTLIDALGLGPVWIRRALTIAPEGDDVAPDWQSLRRAVCDGRASGLVGRDWDRDRDQDGDAAHSAGDEVPRCAWLVFGAGRFEAPAARLLDAMLASIGLGGDRSVFVADLLTGGAGRASVLAQQIDLLAPRTILLVGDGAVASLCPGMTVDGLRGRVHRVAVGGREITAVATFDPRRLLQDGAAKAMAWSDLCLVRAVHHERSME